MSSKRRVRRNQCGAKVRHATHADAMLHLRSLRSRDPLNAYRCAFCKGWHVGHRPGQNPTMHRGRRP